MGRMKDLLHRWRHATSGAAATEFALIAPMLMVMAVGLIDFGVAIRAKSDIEGAARAGLQKGFGNMWDSTAISTAVKNAFSTDTATQNSLTITATPSCYCDGALSASGSRYTGLMLLISAYTGIGTGRLLATFISARPPAREPVKPTA